MVIKIRHVSETECKFSGRRNRRVIRDDDDDDDKGDDDYDDKYDNDDNLSRQRPTSKLKHKTVEPDRIVTF